MKFITWAVLFILGFSCTSLISLKNKLLFRVGLSFPLGFGLNSLIMFLLDIAGIPINNIMLIMGIDLLLSLVFIGLTVYIQKPKLKELQNNFQVKELFPVNLAWVFLVTAIFFVAYVLIYKTVFWPVTTYDSVNGYDFLAKVIRHEGSFNNSIFSKEFPLSSVRSYYPPLVPLNLSIAYLAGFSNTKIVMAFYFASIIIAFYAILKHETNHLSAAFFTLLLIITPEFAAFSALSSPNPPCTFYSAIGLLSFYHWYKTDQLRFYTIGLLLIFFALWTRTETVIFAISSGLLILLKSIHHKKFKLLLIYGFLIFVALAVWQLYLKFNLQADSQQPIIKHIMLDFGRLERMLTKVFKVTFDINYYGLAVYFFLGMIAINIRNILKEKDRLLLLGLIFSTWFFYLLIYNQIDTDYLPGDVAWIEAGYKRGFFYFLPLMFYYCATNKISLAIFNKILILKKKD